MRRSLYLGDTVYEVIAEPGYEVRLIFHLILKHYKKFDFLRKKVKYLLVLYKQCMIRIQLPL